MYDGLCIYFHSVTRIGVLIQLNKIQVLTLSVYMVQFVISSESIDPRRPNRAPDAPTETEFLTKRAETMLPPIPETRYITPTRTAESTKKNLRKTNIKTRN